MFRVRAMLLGIGLLFAAIIGATDKPYLGTPEDFMKISQLYARYSYSIDHNHADEWAQTFTSDGAFKDPDFCAIGRAQLEGLIRGFGMPIDEEKHFHVSTPGPIVYHDSSHARIHSFVMVVAPTHRGVEGGGVLITGTYDDQLVRVDGQWLFVVRIVNRWSAKPPVACAVKGSASH
jgi:hypothetical protein